MTTILRAPAISKLSDWRIRFDRDHSTTQQRWDARKEKRALQAATQKADSNPKEARL